MMRAALFVVFGAFSLAGCAEQDQTVIGIKSDADAFQGTQRPQPYMAAGWKQGDRGSWEQHMKVRTQAQNDYVKME